MVACDSSTGADQRRMGVRAAATSSGRLIGVVCGASWSVSASSSAMCQQDAAKRVEGFAALAFGGLDHEGFGDDEGEVDGGGVDVVVEQPLGDIHGADAAFAEQVSGGGDEFVHAAARRGARGSGA